MKHSDEGTALDVNGAYGSSTRACGWTNVSGMERKVLSILDEVKVRG